MLDFVEFLQNVICILLEEKCLIILTIQSLYAFTLAHITVSNVRNYHFYRMMLCECSICCHCVCVHLSICLLHAGIVPKRLNIRSRKQHRTITQGLFLLPIISAKF